MGLDLMNTFPSYLEIIQLLDSFLMDLEEPPTWTLEGQQFSPGPCNDSCMDTYLTIYIFRNSSPSH